MLLRVVRMLAVSLSLVLCVRVGFGQTTAITYQGVLRDQGQPANGDYEFRFHMFDAPTGGNFISGTLSITLPVVDGVFTADFDLGSNFPGAGRWLEILVRKAGSNDAFTTLSPRQAITPVPYANGLEFPFAGVADTASPALAVTNTTGAALTGTSSQGPGVHGITTGGMGARSAGVIGESIGPHGTAVAGFANMDDFSTAIYGEANSGGYAIDAYAPIGHAGLFQGSVDVIGNLSKSGGSFKIDHPLDPANKYLYHSFVESPDMMNIYNGVVTTDARGYATVVLPDWFDTLNRDFRYQLTVVDDGYSDDFVLAKIVGGGVHDNQFALRTSAPGVKVSWQVTGIRQDAWANAHRIPVEELKPESERGYYLHPELYGLGEDRNMEAARVHAAEANPAPAATQENPKSRGAGAQN